MFRDIKEALECLGEEAAAVYHGKADGPWELHPESAADEPIWHDWCDDCETFHSVWYVIGYEVALDQVEAIVWSCDSDGNWDVQDSAIIGSSECGVMERNYGHDAWLKNNNDYLAHVAETGSDPCVEFMPPSPTKTKEDWVINVVERDGKVLVTRAHLVTTGEGHGEIYENPENLPDYVKEFLLLGSGETARVIDPEYVKCIGDLSGGDSEWVSAGLHPGEWVARTEIEKSVPSMTDNEWAKELKLKAKAALT